MHPQQQTRLHGTGGVPKWVGPVSPSQTLGEDFFLYIDWRYTKLNSSRCSIRILVLSDCFYVNKNICLYYNIFEDIIDR